MGYNPYANFGMQSLYRPRQILNPNAMPGMAAQSPNVNPGKPPNIRELVDAYLKHKDAQAAVEAHHAGSAGAGGSGVLGGGAAGAGGYWALSQGGGATAAPALELAASAPEMMLPELAGSSVGTVGGGSGATIGGGANIGGSGGGASSGGMMAGGPGTLGYWAGPAAFMAASYVAAPYVNKYGKQAGQGFMKATGLKKKRYDREYTPETASKSVLINRQLPGLDKADPKKQSDILNKFKDAKAMIVPSAADPDLSKAEGNTRDASRIGISSAYLTDREKDKLKSKYGKNYHFGAIKPEDLADILSPIGRNQKGQDRLVSFNDAVKSYKQLGG